VLRQTLEKENSTTHRLFFHQPGAFLAPTPTLNTYTLHKKHTNKTQKKKKTNKIYKSFIKSVTTKNKWYPKNKLEFLAL